MPILLFQIALVLIIIHAIYGALQSVHNQSWFEFSYQLAIGVAALWFLLDHV